MTAAPAACAPHAGASRASIDLAPRDMALIESLIARGRTPAEAAKRLRDRRGIAIAAADVAALVNGQAPAKSPGGTVTDRVRAALATGREMTIDDLVVRCPGANPQAVRRAIARLCAAKEAHCEFVERVAIFRRAAR